MDIWVVKSINQGMFIDSDSGNINGFYRQGKSYNNQDNWPMVPKEYFQFTSLTIFISGLHDLNLS